MKGAAAPEALKGLTYVPTLTYALGPGVAQVGAYLRTYAYLRSGGQVLCR